MIPAIDVRHDLKRLSADLALLPKETMAAAVRALNRTMITVRAEAARTLRVELPRVKVSALKARIKLQRASRERPVAALTFSGRRFALYGNFGMRTLSGFGVRFSKLPWRIETISGDTVTPEMLARAFRQRSRRGGRASVFARHTKVRESFEILVAPGVARAFAERGIGDALVQVTRDRFAIVFQQEAKFTLSKRA